MTTTQDNQRLIIDSEIDDDGGLTTKITAEKNYIPQFYETFYSIEKPIPLKFIGEEEIRAENAEKSATIRLLKDITEIIGRSMKMDSHIHSQKELDDKFELTDRNIIRMFEQISGVRFDHSKFRTRKAFQEYMSKILVIDSLDNS